MALKHRLSIVLVALVLLLVGPTSILAQQRTHTVQSGETLGQIALQYGVTAQQLAAVNGIINPDLIYAGQVLTIPTAGGEGGQVYVVQSGDTLFRIAQRFGTTVANLVALNGLANPDVLYVGQTLVISPGGGAAPVTPAATTPPTTTTTHVVQRGETLYTIALRYGTTYQQIALLNGLTNPNRIFAGQTLLIPMPGTVASAPITAPTATTIAYVSTPGATTTTALVPPMPVPTATTVPIVPTLRPTSTVPPTITPTIADVVPSTAPNRLTNPGFEGRVRPVVFGEVNVFEGWQPFYCGITYTPSQCPAPRIGAGNPPGLLMGRPEYKPAVAEHYPGRVHSGETAQQWFCFFRTCQAGVYQTFNTTPGALCEVGAYVQSWSTGNANITGDRSMLDGPSDRENSTWVIRVDLDGGTYAFANGLLSSQGFSYSYEPWTGYNREHGGHGVYDQYVPINFTFIATGSRTTVFFENTRLWPFPNNDNYIDDAWARCTH